MAGWHSRHSHSVQAKLYFIAEGQCQALLESLGWTWMALNKLFDVLVLDQLSKHVLVDFPAFQISGSGQPPKIKIQF